MNRQPVKSLAAFGCIVLLLLLAAPGSGLRAAEPSPTPAAEASALPPMPLPATGADQAHVLYPDLADSRAISDAQWAQPYVLLARAGDTLKITMQRTSGDLNPYLALLDGSGASIIEQGADLSGKTAVLATTVNADAWFLLTASREGQQTGSSTGGYRLTLSGASRALYELLPFGAPPVLQGAQLLTGSMDGATKGQPVVYLVRVTEGESLTVQLKASSQPEMSLVQADGSSPIQAEPGADALSVTLHMTSDTRQWLRLTVSQARPGPFHLSVQIALNGPVPDALDTILTPTFTPTLVPTPTWTPTATLAPSLTPTETPTETLTPTEAVLPLTVLLPTQEDFDNVRSVWRGINDYRDPRIPGIVTYQQRIYARNGPHTFSFYWCLDPQDWPKIDIIHVNFALNDVRVPDRLVAIFDTSNAQREMCRRWVTMLDGQGKRIKIAANGRQEKLP